MLDSHIAAHKKHDELISLIPECHKNILTPLALSKYFRSRLNKELKVDREKAKQEQQYAGKTATMESGVSLKRKRKSKSNK